MRCYFLRDGHIADVEVLNVRSDEDAIEEAKRLFVLRTRQGTRLDGFEVWELSRVVHRSHPLQKQPS